MSDVFGIGTAAGQIGSALISANAAKKAAAKQYHYQSLLQAQAAQLNYEYSEKTARNSPTWNRAGLESAGYNPMLAVQNSTGGANSNFTSSGQAQNVDYSSSISNAFDFQRLKNETKQADSNSRLADEQAQTEEDKRINLRFDSMMKDAKKHMIDKATSWIDKEKNAKIYKDMQDAERARAEASVVSYNAETARIASDAQKLNAEVAEKWTPGKIGAGLAVAGLGLLGPGKFVKPLKNVTKISKRSRNGRNSIIQTFNEY